MQLGLLEARLRMLELKKRVLEEQLRAVEAEIERLRQQIELLKEQRLKAASAAVQPYMAQTAVPQPGAWQPPYMRLAAAWHAASARAAAGARASGGSVSGGVQAGPSQAKTEARLTGIAPVRELAERARELQQRFTNIGWHPVVLMPTRRMHGPRIMWGREWQRVRS